METNKYLTMGELTNYVSSTNRIFDVDDILDTKPNFYATYKINSVQIDRYFTRKFKHYVIDDIDSISAMMNKYPSRPFSIILTQVIRELHNVTTEFLITHQTVLDRLWELESVSFNPIENYDRIEESTTIRTGTELNNLSKNGTDTNILTRSGSYTDESNNNDSGTTTVKNNQILTTKNKPTAYNTNLVEQSINEYSGEGDTNTSSMQSTNTSTHTENNRKDSAETTYNTTDTSEHIYNDITDRTTSRIHGNIGVTTSTAMMAEYNNFYQCYNFWEELFYMLIHYICRYDFETEVEYED